MCGPRARRTVSFNCPACGGVHMAASNDPVKRHDDSNCHMRWNGSDWENPSVPVPRKRPARGEVILVPDKDYKRTA